MSVAISNEEEVLGKPFHYESPHDSTNELTVALIVPETYRDKRDLAGGIVISVANEQAVDSYNAMFECDISLDRKTAIQFRDWLNKLYP